HDRTRGQKHVAKLHESSYSSKSGPKVYPTPPSRNTNFSDRCCRTGSGRQFILIDAPAREKLKRVLEDQHLHIGGIIFPELDQVDFTGPFEVFSRLPNTTFHVIAKTPEPIRDVKGLVLTPQMTLDDAPDLDVLCVPGGVGIRNVLEDEQVLEFIRAKADKARYVFSVCTGALVCGAAGLLRGCRATTHWASFHLLPYFGAIPVDHRVVIDQDLITTAGVTAGIDGALRLAALLRGDAAAQQIQL